MTQPAQKPPLQVFGCFALVCLKRLFLIVGTHAHQLIVLKKVLLNNFVLLYICIVYSVMCNEETTS